MFEALSEELARTGLSINGTKTKILTTDSSASDSDVPLLADAGGCMVEILRCDDTHKYLGRLFSGDLRRRGQCNLNHRLACGWLKFHNCSTSLMNKKIPIHLRLKLFQSVVTPVACYSLSTTPLTAAELSRLDACQRKMLRKTLGWVRLDDESWEATGQRIKARLEAALQSYPVQPWSAVRGLAADRLLQCNSAPSVVKLALRWLPRGGHRQPGRPRQRWHAALG